MGGYIALLLFFLLPASNDILPRRGHFSLNAKQAYMLSLCSLFPTMTTTAKNQPRNAVLCQYEAFRIYLTSFNVSSLPGMGTCRSDGLMETPEMRDVGHFFCPA